MQKEMVLQKGSLKNIKEMLDIGKIKSMKREKIIR